jgi:hypothetical protein
LSAPEVAGSAALRRHSIQWRGVASTLSCTPCHGRLAQGRRAGATSPMFRAPAADHGQRIALAQAERTRAAVDLDQRLGERLGDLAGLVGGIDHAHHAVLAHQKDGRRVLAADARPDARGLAGEPADLADQET